MKLLPLVPYHFFVPGYARAAKDANDPHRDDVNGTGMLGPASSNLGAMRELAVGRGNGIAMRIEFRAAEHFVDALDQPIRDDVFHLLGVLSDSTVI